MKIGIWMALAVSAALAGLLITGCNKKKSLDQVDLAYHHSPEGVHEKLQEQRTVLADALKRQEFVYIHDQAYYVQGLVDALAANLDEEKKERLAPKLKEISHLIDKVHDAAGGSKQDTTEARLQELFEALKGLEPEFKTAKKK